MARTVLQSRMSAVLCLMVIIDNTLNATRISPLKPQRSSSSSSTYRVISGMMSKSHRSAIHPDVRFVHPDRSVPPRVRSEDVSTGNDGTVINDDVKGNHVTKRHKDGALELRSNHRADNKREDKENGNGGDDDVTGVDNLNTFTEDKDKNDILVLSRSGDVEGQTDGLKTHKNNDLDSGKYQANDPDSSQYSENVVRPNHPFTKTLKALREINDLKVLSHNQEHAKDINKRKHVTDLKNTSATNILKGNNLISGNKNSVMDEKLSPNVHSETKSSVIPDINSGTTLTELAEEENSRDFSGRVRVYSNMIVDSSSTPKHKGKKREKPSNHLKSHRILKHSSAKRIRRSVSLPALQNHSDLSNTEAHKARTGKAAPSLLPRISSPMAKNPLTENTSTQSENISTPPSAEQLKKTSFPTEEIPTEKAPSSTENDATNQYGKLEDQASKLSSVFAPKVPNNQSGNIQGGSKDLAQPASKASTTDVPPPLETAKTAATFRSLLMQANRKTFEMSEPLNITPTKESFTEIVTGKYINLTMYDFDYSEDILKNSKAEFGLTSDTAGYVQTPSFKTRSCKTIRMDAWVTVSFGDDDVIMVSFPFVNILRTGTNVCKGFGQVAIKNGSKDSQTYLPLNCPPGRNSPSAIVYETNRISVSFSCTFCVQSRYGFKMLFSAHKRHVRIQKSAAPQRLSDGRWNCSAAAHWNQFRHHLLCNNFPECSDGSDEDADECAMSSKECGAGRFLMGARCYRLFSVSTRVPGRYKVHSVVEASARCLRGGGQLVSLNSPEEWVNVLSFLTQHVKPETVFMTGLRTAPASLPKMYKKMWQYPDGTMAYYVGRSFSYQPTDPTCMLMRVGSEEILFSCRAMKWSYMCEFNPLAEAATGIRGNGTKGMVDKVKPATRTSLSASPIPGLNPRVSFRSPDSSDPSPSSSPSSSEKEEFIRCPEGHYTWKSLACDLSNACWSRGVTRQGPEGEGAGSAVCKAPLSPLPPPGFVCDDGVQVVPYDLVCDFRDSCVDGSDEEFCTHPTCDLVSQFQCNNKECINISHTCDHVEHCKDGSDETLCSGNAYGAGNIRVDKPPPVRIDYNGYSLEAHEQSTLHCLLDQPFFCPETHFQCANNGFCLPVFLLCNGVLDCPDGEDEAHCQSFTCAGFYRCRASRVCVSFKHLCDGFFQCPHNDDELGCGLHCPPGCTCYRMTFFCHTAFETQKYTYIRYLDASGSDLDLGDAQHVQMLIYLGMSRCNVRQLVSISLLNLHVFDLSHNHITTVTVQHLQHLPHLRHISLAGNPLSAAFSGSQNSVPPPVYHTVWSINLAGVTMETISMGVFAMFPALRYLNLSSCGVNRILNDGLHVLAKLRTLDLRGCPVTHFPQTVFQGWDDLGFIIADNYKLCCPSTLPRGFNPSNCKAKSDEVSSCGALLRSDMYRSFLSVFAALALIGNLISFVARVFVKKIHSSMGFDVFVASLCVSDFAIGLYLAMIGVADRVYQGTYLWYDVGWRYSATCKAAGFVSLLSSEVSALMICVITLDRFLAMKFPLGFVRFNRRSASITCGCLWILGIALATVPLLPANSHWNFYSQTGICVPLPITRNDFAGFHYTFGVLIVFNFILFVLIAMGQLAIYCAVQANRMSPTDETKPNATHDLKLARRLFTVAITDFMCWFPIGLVGILAATGTTISGEVSVGLVIFVLPLNSVINPFLYTVNMLMERIQERREERLKQLLLARLHVQTKELMDKARLEARKLQVLTSPEPLERTDGCPGGNQADNRQEEEEATTGKSVENNPE